MKVKDSTNQGGQNASEQEVKGLPRTYLNRSEPFACYNQFDIFVVLFNSLRSKFLTMSSGSYRKRREVETRVYRFSLPHIDIERIHRYQIHSTYTFQAQVLKRKQNIQPG